MNEWQIVASITRTILMMSVTGSVVALLLFALKPMIRDRIPKNAQYYLWLVVIVCLLVPFSRLITLPSPEPIAWIHEAIDENIKPNNQWWDEISQERYQTSFESLDAPEQIDVMYKSGSAMRWELNKSLVGYPVIYPPIVFLIIVLQYMAFCVKLRLRRESPLPEDATMLNELCMNRKAPRLFRNRVASTPMLIGLFRPAIILPDCEYEEDQLRYVLLHELTHLRRGDMMIRWLTVIACSVHWFNPIVWLAKREIDRACELAYDEAVISSLSDDDKQTYGDTLLFVAADGKSFPAALAMSENKRNLKERLRAIMISKKRTGLVVAMSAELITVVAVGGIAIGAGNRNTKTFDLENTTRIEIRSGTTGNIVQITDTDELRIVCDSFMDNEFIRVGSSKDSTGWEYRLTFYTDEVVTEDIIVISDNRINYDGYFWEREGGQ
jgi:beta-lactamase regulating signal transducer with metallopeptidase domain